MTDTVALVVAAGRGQRFGGPLPKQYAELAGRPVLGHALARLTAHPRIDRVQAVIHPDDRALYDRAAAGLELPTPISGGPSRQDSVRLGLEGLAPLAPRTVLIHDGARPFVGAAVIDRVLDALGESIGAIAALPVTDTLKRGEDGRIAETVARSGLCRVGNSGTSFSPSALLSSKRTWLFGRLK